MLWCGSWDGRAQGAASSEQRAAAWPCGGNTAAWVWTGLEAQICKKRSRRGEASLRLCGCAALRHCSGCQRERGADRKMPRRPRRPGKAWGGRRLEQAKVRSFGAAAESGSLVHGGWGRRRLARCRLVQVEGQMVEGWVSPTERHDAASLLAPKTVSSYPTGLISPAAACRAMGFGRGLAALGHGVPGLAGRGGLRAGRG
jgi:hypothetical protein